MGKALSPDTAALPAPVPQAAPAAATPERKGFRILVVEDNSVNQKVVLAQLKKLGYAADTVANGLEALQSSSLIPYDLILMDCQMPEMDGYEASREIRRREAGRARVPIIAMTAHALVGDRERCLEAGMDEYITKPITLAALAKMLVQWCPAVDPQILKRLRGLGDDVFFQELVESFLKAAPVYLGALKGSAARREPQAIRQSAHTLKGCSGNFGARGIRTLCERIEALAGAADFSGVSSLVDALEGEFEQVRRYLLAAEQSGSDLEVAAHEPD